MRPALFAALCALAMLAAAQPNSYTRPVNADCVDNSVSSSEVSLFPKEYMASGYLVNEDDFKTQVGSVILL
jgi:hypothetical protein